MAFAPLMPWSTYSVADQPRAVTYWRSSGLFVQAADGTGGAEQVLATSALRGFSLSPDGTTVVFDEGDSSIDSDLYMSLLGSGQSPEVLLPTSFVDEMAAISPDGRWLAYVSDELGQENIVVVPFPDVDGGRWTISTDFGREPRWHPNGQELFYRGPNGVVAVEFQTEPTFRPGASTVLFPDRYQRGGGTMYDVSADGERFLMVKRRADAMKIVLVKNWSEELKRLVPTN